MQPVGRSVEFFRRLAGRRAEAASPECRLVKAVRSLVLRQGCLVPAAGEEDRLGILPEVEALHIGLAEVVLVGHPIHILACVQGIKSLR
jgi:hypothetical protein